MPRKIKFTPGPSRLSRILQNLTRGHRPVISQLKAIRLALAARNDHWGARHFVAEELPRIQYANPEAKIEVNKVPKTPKDSWRPEMIVELRNGEKHTFDLDAKHSSSIFAELMDKLGGSPWTRWKHQRTQQYLPIIVPPTPVPSKLDIKVEALGPKVKKVPGVMKELKERQKREVKSGKGREREREEVNYEDMFFRSDKPKTGAAAVLP